MTALDKSAVIGIVGAGTMGVGIAQVAAAARHPVRLWDAAHVAADNGKQRLESDLQKLVDRGKMEAAERDALLGRVTVVKSLTDLAPSALVIEAIVEKLEIKRELFAELEGIVASECILATNTSSISVTSIARNLEMPGRMVGMHFFNPAPIMKLVEVVSGVATDGEVARTVKSTAEQWGKVAIHTKSTPGFIVNRVARPYYAEALRLLEEQVADAATLDALLTEGGGFRMGPFALMDLIGHDVNYQVTLSVFEAFYHDPRFRPSIVQLELVNAGRFGRKSGRGFFRYDGSDDNPQPVAAEAPVGTTTIQQFSLGAMSTFKGVTIAPTDGRTAAEVAASMGAPAIIYDLFKAEGASRLGFTASSDTPEEVIESFVATMAERDVKTTRLPDWPGLVVMRTVVMLANEGFEAVMQAVSDEAGVDAAMRFGVNYPKGPITWAREIGLQRVADIIDNLLRLTGDPRYRVSLGLRRAAQQSKAA
ncbi:3-hydroxyacyl-CoA dehydrogenase [Falsochrobactrum shanghaiense]|uniref:3-hydroxyacyl-CoA dehydrogenase n=1 Tax=Falsochrobactrum shanghaiense TaxID=2201899 RepID=A0A316J6U1_9HYPH|nr:3-hydroxyacyl-CoA dehydrogenase [Falsochrobactrum shanghaiense]PWL16485.1 3-hydroxyacyl-CoA dehydrogenase [Falsochrobactrum shanghaiense]